MDDVYFNGFYLYDIIILVRRLLVTIEEENLFHIIVVVCKAVTDYLD